MGVLLAATRRAARRLATAAVILYASTGVLATASVCMPGPHRHHGVPAPDCVMHHQGDSHHGSGHGSSQHHAAGSAGHHGGHGAQARHATAPSAPESAINCACGGELRAMHPADALVLAPAEPWAPVLLITGADTGFEPRLPSFDPRSASPPPRA